MQKSRLHVVQSQIEVMYTVIEKSDQKMAVTAALDYKITGFNIAA